MAKRGGGGGGGGDSGNTGLVVSLVIASLLVIGLGVGTYLGFSGQTDAKAAEAAAKKEKTNVQNSLDETKAVLAALRLAVGTADGGDLTAFTGGKAKYAAQMDGEVKKLSAKVQEVKWDITGPGAPDSPAKSCATAVAELKAAVTAQKDLGDSKVREAQEKMKTLDDARNDAVRKEESTAAKLKDALQQVETVRNAKSEEFMTNRSKLDSVSKEKNEMDLARQDVDVKKSAEVKTAQELAASKERKLEELRTRIGPLLERIDTVRQSRPELQDVSELYDLITRNLAPFSAVGNDTPKGKVTRIDRTANVVYVNLGSADYLRPGVTFSVLPVGTTGKTAAGRDRKGAIEIVAVLEPHLSTAKVIDAPNAVRDPLLPGDLLFNPAWSPTNRQHVALAGIFDLNGDGVDDVEDLKRTLAKAGVEVDAWLDIKDRKVKGPGLTERTTFLIQGVKPQPSTAQGLDTTSPVQSALLELLGVQTEFEDKAAKLGVEKVPYQKFLAMIGYKLPKTGVQVDASASSYLRDAKGQIKATEKDKEK